MITEQYPAKYSKECEALEKFIAQEMKVELPWEVHVFAFEDKGGGFRIAEIDISHSGGGCSYMRSEADAIVLGFILAAEDFVRDFNIKAYRPKGWESDLDEAADARWKLERIVRDLREQPSH